MTPISKALVFVSTLSVSACAQSHTMQNKFVAEEYKVAASKGDLIGKVRLSQTRARITFCLLIIVPATEYTREWAQATADGRQVDNSGITRIRDARAGGVAVCDGSGNFAAGSLGSGRWIVLASLLWYVGRGRHEDTLWGEVDVQPNKTSQILLTP